MTIREVAKHAGVSLQTVSNVINGRSSQMAPETRERVLQSIKVLGYQPNLHARGLRSQRTFSIGFLTLDPSDRFLADPFHTIILSGMADILRERDYGLLVQALHPDKPGDMFTRLYQQRRFDGAVVHLSGTQAARQRIIDQMAQAACPLVLMEERVEKRQERPQCMSLRADNRAGAERAVEYLHERGHKRIGFLMPELPWPAVEERLAGYTAALKRLQGPEPDVWQVAGEHIDRAREVVETAFRRSVGITALLCSNDVLAVGALHAAKALKRRVPDQLAIIGFDDFDFSQYVEPPLTTVALPAYEMGRKAAQVLLDYMQNDHFADSEVVFPTSLVCRGTA